MWKMPSFIIFETRLKKNIQLYTVGLVILTRVTGQGPHQHDLRHQWSPWLMKILQPSHSSEG